MKSILVTGGNGYKGSVLIPSLLEKGYKVRSIDTNWFGDYLKDHKNLEKHNLDIRNIKEDLFKEIDVVIHLANIANDPAVELNPLLSWEVNVLSSYKIANFAKKCGVKTLIFASSGSVYGLSDEERVTEKAELVPISEYNKTKMIAERVFLSFKEDMQIYCVRPATVCGVSPRMRLDVSVNILTYSALKNKVIRVFGGNQVRPNIHIDDICSVYEFLLESNNIESGCYNAGFENISILDIAKLVQKKLPNSKIIIEGSNDPRSYRQCSDLLLSLGFKPKKNVALAIEEIIKAYKEKKLYDGDYAYTVKTLKNLKIS
mgnify:CR=1 FL=1